VLYSSLVQPYAHALYFRGKAVDFLCEGDQILLQDRVQLEVGWQGYEDAKEVAEALLKTLQLVRLGVESLGAS
jgi:hypothetical protein